MSTQDTAIGGLGIHTGQPTINDGRRLISRLELIQSIRMSIGAGAGVVWSSLAFLATMIAWMWADVVLDLSPGLRITGWGCAIVVFCGLLIQNIRLTRRTANPSAIASDLDQLTSSGGQIRSGLDLATTTSQRELKNSSPLTLGLAQLAIRKAATLASHSSSQTAASPLPIAKSFAAALGAFICCVIIAAAMPRMVFTELKRFFNPHGGHPAWSQYEFKITPNHTSVTYGDSLEVEATVAGPPFEQLEMVLIPTTAARAQNNTGLDAAFAEPIDVLPMFADASGIWRASVVDIKEPFELFLRIRRARSETVPIEVITVPEVRDVTVEVAAPLYTGLSPYRGVIPPKGIEGLIGTRVVVTATSNRPLSGGRMELLLQTEVTPPKDSKAETVSAEAAAPVATELVAMSVGADAETVTGEFVLSRPGQFHVYVTDAAGQSNSSPITVPIRLLEDQSPMVRLAQPRAVSFATPNAKIPVVVAAEDDYGIRRCQLFRSLNNSRPLPADLPIPNGIPRRLFLQSELPLAQYGLQPGDEIRLFARVEDNDPNGPAAPIGKGAESSIVSIRIISEVEFNRSQQQRAGMEMMMSRHQQAQRRLESIAEKMWQLNEKLEAAGADSELGKELREEMKALASEMKEAAESIQKLADAPLPFEMDQEMAKQLSEMAKALSEMSESTEKMSAKEGLNNKEAAEQMKQQMANLQKQQQKHQDEAMKPLEHLAQVLPLKQDESMFVQLVQRQRSLADRLQSLKDANADSDPAMRARMRELEEEQHRLREQLSDLLNKIDEDISRLPDDPELDELRKTAQKFVDDLRASGADTMMADAESGLTGFDGGQGAAKAAEAAETLERFMSQCNGMGQACNGSCMKFSPGMGSSMSNTLDQLVPGMGSKSGMMGMGAGSGGGYSSQSSTMDNVGMYGMTPFIDPSQASSGNSDSETSAGIMSRLSGEGSEQSGSEFSAGRSNSALGNSETGVPSQYRRQAGKYMQRLAEELEQ